MTGTPMPDVQMILGKFKFEIASTTFQEMQRARTAVWNGQKRVANTPVYHFNGEDEETITLTGVHFPRLNKVINPLNELQFARKKGLRLPLIDGRGHVWGKYGIKSIQESVDLFYQKGVPRRLSFTLELVRVDP
jgi:uncharacterized protein